MSGFAVVVARRGQPIVPEIIASIRDALAFRGPDGINSVILGNSWAVHAALHTTPQSLHETQPYRHPSGTVYVSDARLDNRGELIEALNWERTPRDTSDIELIAEAHHRWGRDVGGHLIGDFAFAAIRPGGRVECYRDHQGVKPVHYWMNAEWLVIASDIRQVIAHPQAPRTVDAGVAGEYLSGYVEQTESTIIGGINRLPGAHGLALDGELRTWRYWYAPLDQPLRLPSFGDYVEGLRSIFDEAVRCRLRTSGAIGTELSGGLDSTSVTGTIARSGREMVALSCTFPGSRRADESEYIDAAVTGFGLPWEPIVNDAQRAPWATTNAAFWSDIPLPPDGPDHVELCTTARGRGCHVVLTGHGGDHWLDAGRVVLPDLVQHGHLISAWNIAATWTDGTTRRTLEKFVRQGLVPFKPHWMARPWVRRAPWVIGAARSGAHIDERRIPGRLPRHYRTFAAQRRYEGDANGYESTTRSMLDRVAATAGVEYRHPFLDRRLIEFACRIPTTMHSNARGSRMLQREALADRMPALVSSRTSKAAFSDVWWQEIERHLPRRRLASTALVQRQWLDLDLTMAALDRTEWALTRPRGAGNLIPMWGVVQVESVLQALEGR